LLGHRVEVRDQQLDPDPVGERVDLPDRLGVQPGTAVGQVVAGHSGDGGVAQPHLLHALGYPARLVPVQLGRLTGGDLAEIATPGALLATDQEGRLAVLPAFVDVRAAGLLADRVQALGFHQLPQLGVLRTHHGPGLDPLRLAFDRGLGVAGLDPQQLAAGLGSGGVDGGVGHARAGSNSESRTVSWDSRASTRGSASATVTWRSSSRLSEVTPASAIPHGTIRSYQLRSGSQFSAKPCNVTPRATRIPIAAILRSGPRWSATSHTPLRPATCWVGRPSSAQTAISIRSIRRT